MEVVGLGGFKDLLHLRTPKLGVIKDWRLGAWRALGPRAARGAARGIMGAPASELPGGPSSGATRRGSPRSGARARPRRAWRS